jgi:hypothetical protein
MLKRNLLVIALLVSCFVVPFASFAEEKAPEAKKEAKCCDDKDAKCCDKTDAKHHKCKKDDKCGSTKEGVKCCEDAAKKEAKKEEPAK